MPQLSNFAPHKKTGTLWVKNNFIKITRSKSQKVIASLAKRILDTQKRKSLPTRRRITASLISIRPLRVRTTTLVTPMALQVVDLTNHTTITIIHRTISVPSSISITRNLLQRTARRLYTKSQSTWSSYHQRSRS